jgi:hypothetical protein
VTKSCVQKFLAIFLILSSCATPARAAHFESGPERVALIELYSSEGCSSCPPADNWMNALRKDKRLWKDFVPIAFHVDYWDHLGWKDVYASSAFTQRQREYSDRWRTNTIYTPGFVLNGKEWRVSRIPAARGDAGILNADTEGGVLSVSYVPPEVMGEKRLLVAHAVPLLFDIRSDVKRGENAGRNLAHEFVAAGHEESLMTAGGGVYTANLPLIASDTKAVAVWITAQDSPEPLQAAGGYL